MFVVNFFYWIRYHTVLVMMISRSGDGDGDDVEISRDDSYILW